MLAPGRICDVDGVKMHIQVSGPITRSPTIIIAGGLGCPGAYYYRLQTILSRELRVVTYDRAGLGWSEAGNIHHDAEHMADYLHILAEQAGIESPFILVGHSLGGLIIRIYAKKYGIQVAGLVFCDVSTSNVLAAGCKAPFLCTTSC